MESREAVKREMGIEGMGRYVVKLRRGCARDSVCNESNGIDGGYVMARSGDGVEAVESIRNLDIWRHLFEAEYRLSVVPG